MILSPLSSKHDRNSFDCGVPEINRYLKEIARQDAEKDMSRTFVSPGDDQIRITGFYTLANSFLSFEEMPQEKKVSRYPAPVALLAQIAVDGNSQGQGIGTTLLFDAQARARDISENIGLHALILDAREESLCAYYEQYDFQRCAGESLRMYKTLTAIRRLNLTTLPLTPPL